MLLKFGKHIGCEGDTRYFVLDGAAWKIGANGKVYRSDDMWETLELRQRFERPDEQPPGVAPGTAR